MQCMHLACSVQRYVPGGIPAKRAAGRRNNAALAEEEGAEADTTVVFMVETTANC